MCFVSQLVWRKLKRIKITIRISFQKQLLWNIPNTIIFYILNVLNRFKKFCLFPLKELIFNIKLNEYFINRQANGQIYLNNLFIEQLFASFLQIIWIIATYCKMMLNFLCNRSQSLISFYPLILLFALHSF